MRIIDWSSDVCSSDLLPHVFATNRRATATNRGSGLCDESCSGYRSSAMTQAPPPFVPGAFVGAAHHYRARVYFEDTDLSGIVYHANYLRSMERARSDMLRLAGLDQPQAMEECDGAWAVTDLPLKYSPPPNPDPHPPPP